MNDIKCPKCKELHGCSEGVTIANNPNLFSCIYCGHMFFVNVKISNQKAYKHSDGYYYPRKEE